MGMPDVFELTIDPGRRAASTFSSSARFTSSRSTTASMIQSASRRRASPSSKPAVVISVQRVGSEERVRLERPRALQPLRGGFSSQIEQQRRNAGVGEMGGNLRAHHAGAKHGHGADHGSSLIAGGCEVHDVVGAMMI